MSEQEQQQRVSETSVLVFRQHGPFVSAELRRADGTDCVLLATIHPNLIETPDTQHLWRNMVEALLNQLAARAGIEVSRAESEVGDECQADD